MPAYVMPAAPGFADLPEFVRGYIEALFFTNDGEPDSELYGATFADFAPETLQAIEADCGAFQDAARAVVPGGFDSLDGYSDEQAGRDFWFTRCGHGVGFWDRPALDVGGLGRALSDLCGHGTPFPNLDPCLGDDGRIYLT